MVNKLKAVLLKRYKQQIGLAHRVRYGDVELSFSARMPYLTGEELDAIKHAGTLSSICDDMADSIFNEQHVITNEKFSEEMTRRLKLVNGLIHKYAQARRIPVDIAAYSSHNFFKELLRTRGERLSFVELTKSFKLFTKFTETWNRAKPKQFGNFTFRKVLFPHMDVPLGIEILNKAGQRVATSGGFFYFKGGKVHMRMCNFQGVKVKQGSKETAKEFAKRKRVHATQYSRLTNELGENWRGFLAQAFVAIARKHKVPISGILPKRYPLTTNKKDLPRQRRVVAKAYESADLVPTKKGTYAPKPTQKRRR
ncbi:MAG: hypothetical protein HOC95_00655 [Candidatus Diapherotrites archaeon]|nr:hypothetical protein [Candidatus Diapherotrites archaeon]